MASKYELALEEVKNNYKLQCDGVDLCKQSARSSMNYSGLILALISILEDKNGGIYIIDVRSILFWGWIITVLIFIIMLFIYVLAVNPIKMVAPIESTKERFNEVFFKQTNKKCLKILIKEYRETIIENRYKLAKVSKLAKWTNILAMLTVVSAFILYIVGGLWG